MELTPQQYDIIHSTGDIKINAVAGSGKTTTIIEYAKARPTTSQILYLAFNKSVKIDAQRKFADKGLFNVKVETAHSLAYKHIVFAHGYKVRPQGYKTNEIAELLDLEIDGEKHAKYIIASHINKFMAYFCNSDKHRVQELNYLDTIFDYKARRFAETNYEYIERQTRIFLGKMDKGEIEVTHDFYLKKFQLSNPVLHYDYILFDEGQDASSAMLDVFFKQKATKVIVGDTYQQIYGWRYAVNSLEKADFKMYSLTTSFRFKQEIANLAMEVLKLKKYIGEDVKSVITGKGTSKKLITKAVIGRTNLGLLLKAIEYVTGEKEVKSLYFEGNINSYTYAEEGASLYDVLNLYNNKRYLVKDKLMKEMRSLADLEDYVEKTEDPQLGMMIEIVKEYGDDIPDIIRSIKDKHIRNDVKEDAELIFSTVHRCKGMEYDAVHIVDDFINEEKLKSLTEDKNGTFNLNKINEEINLLYVAVTRAKTCLFIPESIVSMDLPASSLIKIISAPARDGLYNRGGASKSSGSKVNGKEYYSPPRGRTAKAKPQHKSAGQPWTETLDQELTEKYCKGISIQEMATYFGRTKSSIMSRVKKLELYELYG